MHKRTIAYTDYDGKERTEDFYFHLSEAEVIEFLTTSGDYTLDKLLERLRTERNGKKIMQIFKDLIYISYGEKSLDGRRFMKSKEIKDNFMETEAYSQLFTELCYDGAKAADFVNKIIPDTLSKKIIEIIKNNPEGIPDDLKEYSAAFNVSNSNQSALLPFSN